MAIVLVLFILAHIGFTIYAFYDMLVNGSLGLFVFNLIGYITIWYLIGKNTRTDGQKVWEKTPHFEVTYEEPSEDDLFYNDPYTDTSSIYKEECLMEESIEYEAYLDDSIGKNAEWQNAFFGNTEHER